MALPFLFRTMGNKAPCKSTRFSGRLQINVSLYDVSLKQTLTPETYRVTILSMIKSFKHKGLKKLYESGSQKGINPKHSRELRLILARLDASQQPEDMNLPGLRLHALKGDLDGFWAVDVSGNWRVFFKFDNNNVIDVDYDDYH